jgi:uncharacterized membrane protein
MRLLPTLKGIAANRSGGTSTAPFPYKTKRNIIFLYILILYSWIVNWKTKISAPNGSRHSLA